MNDPCRPSAIEIQQWTPHKLDHIVGNREFVEYIRDSLEVEGMIPNTLVTGESRSGKTSGVKFLVKALMCYNRSPGSTDPCDACSHCKSEVGRYEQSGIFVDASEEVVAGAQKRHFLPIDCTRENESDFRRKLDDFQDFDGLRIVYLDELHRLKHRGMDELLLKPLEEFNFVWIASSATVTGLERMFLNRFAIKIRTQLPTRNDLAEWLARRCRAWEISWDDPLTLLRLSDLSNVNPGKSIQVLARVAATRSRSLTIELVEAHRFDEDD